VVVLLYIVGGNLGLMVSILTAFLCLRLSADGALQAVRDGGTMPSVLARSDR